MNGKEFLETMSRVCGDPEFENTMKKHDRKKTVIKTAVIACSVLLVLAVSVALIASGLFSGQKGGGLSGNENPLLINTDNGESTPSPAPTPTSDSGLPAGTGAEPTEVPETTPVPGGENTSGPATTPVHEETPGQHLTPEPTAFNTQPAAETPTPTPEPSSAGEPTATRTPSPTPASTPSPTPYSSPSPTPSGQTGEVTVTHYLSALYADSFTLKKGDHVLLGKYEQDNVTSNGSEEIEWIVLVIEDGRALLVSLYALDTLPYNTEYVPVTWESCSLREWLNGSFYSGAFTSSEKDVILHSTVPAGANPRSEASPGNATVDNVFLLSYSEAETLFGSNKERMCTPTELALAHGGLDNRGYSDDYSPTCWWWLRSPGTSTKAAACVYADGSLYHFGYGSPGSEISVRPAVWVSTERPAATPTPVPETPVPGPTPEPTPVPAPSIDTKAGDIVSFGRYEQDNNSGNGAEEIEWLVLEVRDGKALLISRYALDTQPYNTEYRRVTWEKCTLRSWLNSEFFLAAFNQSEQQLVSRTIVTAEANPNRDTYTGFDTKDKVFLLSINEVNTYFGSKSKQVCTPTAYAIAKGAHYAMGYGENKSASAQWWLRTPGADSRIAAIVNIIGELDTYGTDVNWTTITVRPAVWVYLDPSNPEITAEPVPADEPSPVNPGDRITFGKYEQDNDESNGKEDIEWVVLDVHDGKAMVMSLYALDAKPYNELSENVTWETCSLRAWLNSEFIDSAFSEEEQERINLTAVRADRNPGESTSPGNPTNDRVYLLSIEEALRYFRSDSELACVSTAYTMSKGAGYWANYWLRTPGTNLQHASAIETGGWVSYGGQYVEWGRYCVRPVMWIDIDQ
ncbi:MAG: hypothetical protein J6U38_07110 [Clostridia bacterium]|nr:hypothetical protein [Clostridia bacterium]